MFSGKVNKVWLILLTIAAVMLLIYSCSTKSTDPKRPNIAPKVEIVNIPPNASHFTSNPQLFWFGRDVDGFIIAYEFAVVPVSLVLAAQVDTSSANAIIAYATDRLKNPQTGQSCVPESCWQVLDVQKTDNPNKQTIRLFADRDPQVYVAQYFFVRAIDNDSARSNIDYRLYSRTNHPPDTEIKTIPDPQGFYDRPETSSVYKGVNFEWKGTDKIDYPSDNVEPTFDYSYQVYGPYMQSEIPYTVDTSGNSVFDPTRFETMTAGKLVIQSRDTATGDTWVTSKTTNVYNLWRNEPLGDTTRVGYFVLKVTARDDAFVPDPTPAYLPFWAINPHLEKQLLVCAVRACAVSDAPGDVFCNHLGGPSDTVIATFPDILAYYREVAAAAGYASADFYIGAPDGPVSVRYPSKLQLAKYKVVLMLQEGDTPKLDSLELFLQPYLDYGGNAWIWATSPFGKYHTNAKGLYSLTKSRIPYYYFNVLQEYIAGWKGSYTAHVKGAATNEQFIGGLALAGTGMPDFSIDYSKLNRTYVLVGDTLRIAPHCNRMVGDSCAEWDPVVKDTFPKNDFYKVRFRGAPNTSYFVRDVYSEPLWLFNSCFGETIPDSLSADIPKLQGLVVGLRYNSGLFKTAVYGFSMYMMEKEKAVEIFRKSMDWFLQ